MDRNRLLTIILMVMIIGTGLFGVLYYSDLSLFSGIPAVTKGSGWNFMFALYGSDDQPFNYPTSVTVHNNRIFVSDSKDPQIRVFGEKGKPLFSIGKGQLKQPYGLVFVGDKLFVSDAELNKIMIFGPKGEFLGDFITPEQVIARPGALAVRDSKLYVSDLGAMQVVEFNLTGAKEMSFGQEGSGDGEFKYPHGIAFDSKGNIYVSDAGNARIQVFNPEGKFLRIIGGKSGETGQIVSARGVALDKTDNVYVSSGLTGKVKVYDKDGKLIKDLGGEGSENGKFALPTGLFIDDQGKLFITEVGNKRVSIFNCY